MSQTHEKDQKIRADKDKTINDLNKAHQDAQKTIAELQAEIEKLKKILRESIK